MKALVLVLVSLVAYAGDRYEEGKAQLDAQYQAALEAQERAEERQRKECGKDYHRVAVGMAWKTVERCSGPFELKLSTAHYKIYDGIGGAVRVENGKVTRVLYR